MLFLGHNETGIATDPSKIEVIKKWPVPANVMEVRSFLGLCGYYRRYIRNFSAKAKCLHRLTEKSRQFVWNPECQESFEFLKKSPISAPILTHPDSKQFILDTGASGEAIGAVLSQTVIEGNEIVISYARLKTTNSTSHRLLC